jgi:hypothetical protein
MHVYVSRALPDYLLARSRSDARMLWKRIPAMVKQVIYNRNADAHRAFGCAQWPHAHAHSRSLAPAPRTQNNPELEAVWRLLQYSWNRHYQGVWQALQGYQWSAALQPLVEALVIKTREELMDLISTAYATVTPAKVASLCGMTEAEALSCGCRERMPRADAPPAAALAVPCMQCMRRVGCRAMHVPAVESCSSKVCQRK